MYVGKKINVLTPIEKVSIQAARKERKTRSSVFKMIQAMAENQRI
jgi:hypothetical protein